MIPEPLAASEMVSMQVPREGRQQRDRSKHINLAAQQDFSAVDLQEEIKDRQADEDDSELLQHRKGREQGGQNQVPCATVVGPEIQR